MSNEHEKLKQEEAEKSSRLQELMYVKSHKNNNTKLTNDIINTKLATPKKIYNSKKSNKRDSRKNSWNDDKIIDHICDYYDELQYNYEYFNDNEKNSNDCKSENITDYLHSNFGGDNKSTNSNNFHNNSLNQYYQLTKIRKDILNRKLIDHRERLKCEKIKFNSDKSLVTSISSLVESLTIPTFHFHLILSLTMVLLTHQCPQYLLVL